MANKTKEEFIATIKQSPDRIRKLGDILDLISQFRIACLNWDVCYRQAREQDFYDICRLGWEVVSQFQHDENELLNCYPKMNSIPLFKASSPTRYIENADKKTGMEWLNEWGAALELTGFFPRATAFCSSFIRILQLPKIIQKPNRRSYLKHIRLRQRNHLKWKKLQDRGDVGKFYHGIEHFSDELFKETMDIVKGIVAGLGGKVNPELRLVVIFCSLKLFRHFFIKTVAVKGPYDSNDKTFWFSDLDETDLSGTLRLVPAAKIVCCSFNTPDESFAPWDRLVYGWKDYEDRLFKTWDYTNGKFRSDDKLDGQAVWEVDNGTDYEYMASEIGKYAEPLLDVDGYREVVQSIVKIIRNGLPKWHPCKIDWEYVNNLDSNIHKLESILKTEALAPILPEKGIIAKFKRKDDKFQHWARLGDACFVLNDKPILFHFNDEIKDLCFGNESKTHRLLFMISSGSLWETDIKKELCKKKTKPSDVVEYANKTLNRHIAQKGFVGVPPNVKFIEYDKMRASYACTLKIHPSKDEFDYAQLKQPLVDDRGTKDLDDAEESY
ncbi:MAG: hypothetical protein ABSG97_04060 [Sedimentisphaerales bacterium]|jgi:hypothetical protein